MRTTQPSQLLSLQADHGHDTTTKNWPSKMLYTFVQKVPGPRLGQNKSYCEWGFLWTSSKQCNISITPWLLPSKCRCHISTTARQLPLNTSAVSLTPKLPPFKHLCHYLNYTTTFFKTPVSHLNYTTTTSSQMPVSTTQLLPPKSQCHISTTQLLPPEFSAISQQHNYFQMPMSYLNYATTTSMQIIFNSSISL